MSFKRIYLSLIIIYLLCGCSQQHATQSSQPQDAVGGEKQLYLIYCLPNNYSDSFESGNIPFSESDWMDDEKLQSEVQEISCIYPIAEDAQITDYAWALYDILIRNGRIEAEYVPYSALSYADGIWRISFLQEEHHGSYYSGKSYIALISAYDGHMISFRLD